MAAHQMIATLVFRLLLPIVLGICAILRFTLMSFAYLLLLLAIPILPAPTFHTMRGHTGRYLKAVVGVSVINFLLQFIFQIVLVSMPPYAYFLEPCSFLETLFRHLGFVRLDNISEIDGTRWLLPECILVVFAPAVYVACLKLTAYTSPDVHLPSQESSSNKNIGLRVLNAVGTYMAVAVIGGAGIMLPSITSAVYFFIFMVSATYWSLNNSLGRRFGYVCRGVMVFSGIHIVCLYIYQTEFMQTNIDPDELPARIFGMTAVLGTNCTHDPRAAPLMTDEWNRFVNPILLLTLYFVTSFESQFLLSNKAALLSPMGSSVRYLIRRSTVRSRSLKSGRSSASGIRSRRASMHSRRRLPQDEPAPVRRESDAGWDTPMASSRSRNASTHSNNTSARSNRSSGGGANGSLPSKLSPRPLQVVDRTEKTGYLLPNNVNQNAIEGAAGGKSSGGVVSVVEGMVGTPGGMVAVKDVEASGNEDEGEGEENPLQRLIAPLISVFQLVIRSSYIATNIVMMAWSITYHSWLTFVLLLWACVLWMIPNQRAAMLRCSPFLVVYAELLLLLQYIYSMDLTEEELPTEGDAVNLRQIGLLKDNYLPVKPLLVKVLYTGMFWITLRQYVQEVVEVTNKEMSTAAALQPFTVAVSTTTTGQPVTKLVTSTQDEPTTSPVMQRLGQWLQGLLAKFWIWLVAIMLFVFGIQGSEVVIFRIMYMVLFLIFTITFQLSYHAWRNFLYGFWLTVIVYQMLVLVLTYTYQFDNFPEYWENYTGIPVTLQNDMGLEVYDTGRLFIKLMTPTFFVIVTIIQVHYFHKDFLALSDMDKIPDQPAIKSSRKPEAKKPVVSPPDLLESCTLDDVKAFLEFYGKKVFAKLQSIFAAIMELGWRFLELHIMRIVLGSVMMLACYDVCALHWVFALLAAVAVPCPERIQTALCRTCVVLASLFLIARMIYQIDYIDPQGWSANCTLYDNETFWNYPIKNQTANNAIWVGLSKAPKLANYLKGYIGIIVVITVQAVVGIRQEYVRKVTGLPPPPPGVLFPNVTRALADDGIPECTKFLLNYGFYKFGVEICLMSLVGVIGTRLDVYSLLYAGWLCYFYNRQRKDIAKVWKGFVIFITVLIPLQYLMCIGIPPGLCTDYPWAGTMNKELREWLFFPDFEKPPESYKIVTDFCLLVFAVCQQRVFEIEFADGAETYEGGSNREIVYEDPASLVNPLPDFVTYTRNYLDLVKNVVFFTSYWVTLAVMFLGGTNRVTLFAMGYVLGAFVFLWLGNEFYLRPLSNILKLWNYLLGYNVGVIVVKTFLQLLGCVVLTELAQHVCWLVQLLGIACVKKFGDRSDEEIALSVQNFCTVPKSEAGLMWDGICFGFLLMQRRLFSSFYFQHLVTEVKSQTILASRGAELIAELMQKEIAEQQAAEREVLNKIKEKMERIKASQQVIKEQSSREPTTHYEANNTSEQFSNVSSPLPLEMTSPLPVPPPAGVDDAQGLSSPRPNNLSATPGAPTPSSANMTLSLDGYLEPTRLSLTTPHFSHQPITSPSEESFPFFSPPPYPVARDRHAPTRASAPAAHDIGPPWLREHMTYHRPSVSTTSPVMSHHTYSQSSYEDTQGRGKPLEGRDDSHRKETYEDSCPSPNTDQLLASAAELLGLTHRNKGLTPAGTSTGACYKDTNTRSSGLRAEDLRILQILLDAIRSGDYYMFEDYGDYEGLAPLEIPEEPNEDDATPGMTVSELLSSALKTDIVEAAEEARQARLSESDAASRRSSFIRRPVHRTLSGRSQVSMGSRTSRTTSRSVRIHPRPRSPPAIPHSPPPLPLSPPPQRSPLSGRPRPPSTLPPLPPLPQMDGGYLADDSTAHDYSEIEPQEPQGLAPVLRKIVHWVKFGWEFLESVMISATQQLNRLSKDYRYVANCLNEEKRRLKETEGFRAMPGGTPHPRPPGEDWSDIPLSQNGKVSSPKSSKLLRKSRNKDKQRIQALERIPEPHKEEVMEKKRRYGGQEPLEIRVEKASEDKTDDSVDFVDLPEGAEKDFKKEQPPLIRLMIACWYAILSRSELVSYIMIFVNQIKSASVLSLPLPLMVFLWGSLSVPRPTKAFWIAVIAYTEMIVLVKYLFQFDFFPWNAEARPNAPFWPPRIVGVEKKDRYAVYDLAVLLVVFFHRFMLKSLGLWKESSDMSSSESADSSPSHSSSRSSFTQSRTSSLAQPLTGGRKQEVSTSSGPTSKEDSSHLSQSGDGSILSYTKDTSLLSKDTRESSLSSKDTKDSSLTSKELKDVSLVSNTKDSSMVSNTKDSSMVSNTKDSSMMSNVKDVSLSNTKDTSLPSQTRESSLPPNTKESSLTWQEDESSLLLNINDDSLMSKTSEAPPPSARRHYRQLSEDGRSVTTRTGSDISRPSRHRSGSEIAYRRTWSPYQSHSRQSSLVSQIPGGAAYIRSSSLVARPHHRRHLSEGSRVSFSQRPLSITSHCTHLSQSQASDSVHVTCAACNLQALKDFQKPDMEEVKEQIQQLPRLAKGGAHEMVNKVRSFLDALLHQESQVSVDVYAYMFFCDFFNFFVLIFGFSAFGTQQGDGGVSAYLEENRVPVPFLVMLILQFGLIIIDRALFLRKFILGKLIFQVALTFCIHIWMFFILPAVTERDFNAKRPPQIWYMVKCLNLLLSAYQIRCGYPTRILGNFLCKQYNYLNLFAFRMFMNVPFLFELRTLMDWIWTDTSMNLSDWVKMEDVFSHIFQLKCERRAEAEYPQGRGEGKRKIIKYGMGGCALFGVIALIWFPLVLFALSNTVGQPNPPEDVSVQISIGAYQPIFSMSAQQQSLYRFNQKDWDRFNHHYRMNRLAQTFLSNYDYPDVVMAELNGDSTAIWGISPPAQEELILDLQSNHTINLKVNWSVKRPSNSPDVASLCKDEKEITLKAYEGDKRNPIRESLVQILEGNWENETESTQVTIKELFPKFLKVSNKGQANFVTQLQDKDKKQMGFVDLEFTLRSAGFKNLSSQQEWWEVQENCSDYTWLPKSGRCGFLTLYTFNDKAFPEGLSFISGGGIVGMYTTLVLVAGKMLRGYFAGSALKIMFDDLPNVDRILQLCLDIYLVRESSELKLEEDLFAKLVFLFRSPETLIKWTRPEEEETPEGADPDGQLE